MSRSIRRKETEKRLGHVCCHLGIALLVEVTWELEQAMSEGDLDLVEQVLLDGALLDDFEGDGE